MRVVIALFFVVTVVTVSAAAGCVSPEDNLDAVIEEASACAAGDTCVVAGFTDCSCGAPVNEQSVDVVNAAADAVSCCDLFGSCVQADCAAIINPRCEDGRCVADIQ